MGTLRHGETTERIDDVDLLHLERVAAHAFGADVAFTLVIDDESLRAPVRLPLDRRTPIQLRYATAIDDERIDDDRMRIMLAALVDSGVLHVPRAR